MNPVWKAYVATGLPWSRSLSPVQWLGLHSLPGVKLVAWTYNNQSDQSVCLCEN
jgi:hypothetical protein